MSAFSASTLCSEIACSACGVVVFETDPHEVNNNAAATQSTGHTFDRTLLERGSTRACEEKDEPLTVADDMASGIG